MEKQTVKVGSVYSINGAVQDFTRPVEFEGRKLAEHKRFIGSDDTRGVIETLYETADGAYVVHVQRWSNWMGEPDDYGLVRVTTKHLEYGGSFEWLGREAGLARPLTLDEVLE